MSSNRLLAVIWTKTAALNDADELANYIASMEPAG